MSLDMLRRIATHIENNKATAIIAAMLVCFILVLFSMSILSFQGNDAVTDNGMDETTFLDDNEAYLIKYDFEIANPWIPFMDNPNSWDNTDNNSGISVSCRKFTSIQAYKDKYHNLLGEAWTFSGVPQEFLSVFKSYDYLLYAEYNDNRVIVIIETNKERSIAASLEFCYRQSEYLNENEFNEVIAMLKTFKVLRMRKEVDSAV